MNLARLVCGAAASLVLAFVLASPAGAQDAGWHVYTDAAHGFSISYPDGWTANPAFADKGYAYSQGDTDDVRVGLGLTPGFDIAPGSTLESNQLVVAVQFARPGDLCKASAFLADTPPDYGTQTQGETADTVHTLAAAGDRYTVEHIVQIVAHAPCMALQIYLVTARPDAGDPRKPYDRAGLFKLLGAIAATLKPLK